MTLPVPVAHARELARLCEHLDPDDVVVIGAAALGHHLPLPRVTHDVDLALVLAPDDLGSLLTGLGWTRDPRIEHRWHGPAAFRADVLPATPEVLALGRVSLGRAREMNLLGLDLAVEHAAFAALPGCSTMIRVASLASLVVLKVVAWLDRPHERTKDLGDLACVLMTALGDDDERRWQDTHPVGSSGLRFDQQSPFFVGLEVAAIEGPAHRRCLDAFTARLLDPRGAAAAAMAREAGLPVDSGEGRSLALVDALKRGLDHGRAARSIMH